MEEKGRSGGRGRAGRGSARTRFAALVLVVATGTLGWAAAAAGQTPYERYEAAVAASGPVAQFRFGDAAGSGTIADSAGAYSASNDGIVLGGEGPFAGAGAGAFGGHSYATLPADPLAGDSEFAVEAWVYWDGGEDSKQRVFEFGSGSGNIIYLTPSAEVSKGAMRLAINTPSGVAGVSAKKPLPTRKWEYVAGSETAAGTLALYLNGEQVGETTAAAITPASLGGDVTEDYLGRSVNAGEPPLEGSMSNVAFYAKALSAAQVREHYAAGVGPLVTGSPTIEGTTRVGAALTVTTGTWSGLQPIGFSYQWESCSEQTCSRIAKATSSSYGVPATLVGESLRAAVTAENAAGSTTTYSAPSGTIEGKPAELAPPAIEGNAEVGQVLTIDPGGWRSFPAPAFSYQWQSCNSKGKSCVNLGEASGSSYRVRASQLGKTLAAVVTAANSFGEASASAEPTAVVKAGPPVNVEAPTVSGVAIEGHQLTATAGGWAGSEPISYAYQWEVCDGGCTTIPQATSSTYTLTAADVGSTVRVAVTAENSVGQAPAAYSPATAEVGAIAPSSSQPPTISGIAKLGQTLTANPGVWSGSEPIDFSYEWQSCSALGEPSCIAIPGAGDESTYTLAPEDVGQTVRVVVTATNAAGSVSEASATTQEVVAAPYALSAPTIARQGANPNAPTTAIEGDELTAHPGEWEGSEPIEYAFQWLSCTSELEGENCSEIAGATGASFTPSAAYLGRRVELRVTATNAVGSAPATSAATSEVRAAGGQVVDWGSNRIGELSAGYRDDYEDKPVPALGVDNATQVAGGAEFNLALLDDGTVRAWGRNGQGQLGDGAQGEAGHGLEYNVAVQELEGVKEVAAANEHSMALLENGTVYAWGNGTLGELGNGREGTIVVEREKEGKKEETAHPVCGIEGTVRVKPKERLPRAEAKKPVQVPGVKEAVAIAAGGGSDYALLQSGEVMAWGQNGSGQLGTGSSGPSTCWEYLGSLEPPASNTPQKVLTPVLNEKGEVVKDPDGKPELTPLKEVAAVSAGESTAYAVLRDGRVMAWGDDSDGQLGDGQRLPEKLNPYAVPVENASTGEPLEGVEMLSGGNSDAVALLRGGEVVGWGAVGPELGEVSTYEECKQVKCIKAARPIGGLEHLKVSDVSSGEGYTLAISEGTVYAFGKDEHGQLGDGKTVRTGTPQPIKGLGAVSLVAGGAGSTRGEVSQAAAVLAPGAQAPTPLFAVEPKENAVHVTWTLEDPEYEVEYKKLGHICEPPEPAGGGEGEEVEGGEAEGEEGGTGSGEAGEGEASEGEGEGEEPEECAAEEPESGGGSEGSKEEHKGSEKWLGIYKLREKEGKEAPVKVWHGFTFGQGGVDPETNQPIAPLEPGSVYSIVVKSLVSAYSEKKGKEIKVLEKKRTLTPVKTLSEGEAPG
jgi:alpha-tubulin suppressor-like RCC1 family protein